MAAKLNCPRAEFQRHLTLGKALSGCLAEQSTSPLLRLFSSEYLGLIPAQ